MTAEKNPDLQISDEKRLELLFDEWKVVIETQMHFNDMIMRVRATGVSVVLAVFGAAAYSLQFVKLVLVISGYKFHVAAPIVSFGLAMLAGLFGLDYFYYYKMLIGSVERGYELDKTFATLGEPKVLGMTTLIRDSVGKPGRAKRYLWFFYGLVFFVGAIFLVSILLGFVPPPSESLYGG